MNPIKESEVIQKSFFHRPADIVAPELIGCMLLKKETNGKILWGIIVETEAYSQIEPACHGHKRKTASNQTLFGDPGHFYVYITYGIYYCVNVVTDKSDFASGVLLRAIAMPNESERIAAGPGLLAKRFGINQTHDSMPISPTNGLWLARQISKQSLRKIIKTTRIGISHGTDLTWRWYLQNSRSVSKRMKGDKCPPKTNCFFPEMSKNP